MSTIGILIVIAGMAIGYGIYFRKRLEIAKAGGFVAHTRAHLDRLFELPGYERVTAAWSAVTIPRLSGAQKAVEVAGAVAAVVGMGVKFVGRPLAIAFTSSDRFLVLDREDGGLRAFGSGNRLLISDLGKAGTKRPSQTRMGWDDGAIVKIEGLGSEPIEIDVAASAVPMLVGWSHGQVVSDLDGPYPTEGTI